jgi:ATP-binding cassette subfamily C protein CydC
MLFWFKSLYRTQFKRVSIGVLLAFFTAFSGLSLLMLSGWFITATALAGIAIAAGVAVIFDMYMPGSGIRFFALSRTVGRYAERLYNHDTILRLVAVYRLSLFKRLSRLSFDELRKTSDSEWLSRLTADLDALDSLLLRFTVTPIVIVLIIILATAFTYLVWPSYALSIGVYLIACAVLAIYLTIKTTKSLGSHNASLLNQLRANVIEHLQGRFELKSLMLMQRHERHLSVLLNSLEQVQSIINNRIANIQFVLDLLLITGICLLTLMTLHNVNTGIIDGPIAVLLVLMFVGISELLQILPTQFKPWGGTSYSANRLSPSIESLNKNDANSVALKSSHELVVVIDKHPNVKVSQLTPLSINIKGTETMVITGQSGSGKSTVANIVSGLATSAHSCGNISISICDNSHITQELEDFSWANAGYLTQSNSILAGTLAYNLTLGLETVTDEQLWHVLKLVELDTWAQSLSNGLDTWLGDTGAMLSGGQARRLSLARLLFRDPAIVILDEPFNGIDTSMSLRIWNNIKDWLAKRKVVLLCHEFPELLLKQATTENINLNVTQNES